MNNFYQQTTDIASECLIKKPKDVTHSHYKNRGFRIEKIEVLKASNSFQKPKGNYYLVELDETLEIVHDNKIVKTLTEILVTLIEPLTSKKKPSFLFVGLGNRHYTPDALGPTTIELIDINLRSGEERPSYTLIPGVMGNTGMESAQIVKSCLKKYPPDIIIAIDSLATRRLERLNRVIQITDTGVIPGSGLGNNRLALNKKFMKIPVISIGVATVCDVPSIILGALEAMGITDEKKNQRIIETVLSVAHQQMVMTTKEIDGALGILSSILGELFNNILQHDFSSTELDSKKR